MPKCTCFCFLIVGWMWQAIGLGLGVIVNFRILHQFNIWSILHSTTVTYLKNCETIFTYGLQPCYWGKCFKFHFVCIMLSHLVSDFWKWSLLWCLCCPFVKTNTVVACGFPWRLVTVHVLSVYCSVFHGLLLGLQWKVLS